MDLLSKAHVGSSWLYSFTPSRARLERLCADWVCVIDLVEMGSVPQIVHLVSRGMLLHSGVCPVRLNEREAYRRRASY